MYLNKVILIGNLTRDPEAKVLPSGMKVTTLGLATNRIWKDKTGARQEDTQYHNVVVFGAAAENVAQYLRKGSSVLVEGRLQTRSWDSADGKKQYRTEVVSERIQFGPKSVGGASFNQARPASQDQASSPAVAKPDVKTIEYPADEVNPEDIPF